MFLSHPHTLTPSQISLLNLIDKSGSECLNENDSHPFTDAIAPGDGFLESDCDEQLVVMLAFQQPVKLHSLQLVGPDDGEGGEGGRVVRVVRGGSVVHGLDALLCALITPHWRCYEAEICTILLLLRCPFQWFVSEIDSVSLVRV